MIIQHHFNDRKYIQKLLFACQHRTKYSTESYHKMEPLFFRQVWYFNTEFSFSCGKIGIVISKGTQYIKTKKKNGD